MDMDRRHDTDRRTRHLLAEPIERKRERRRGDRRESPRVACSFRVVTAAGVAEVEGELGLGGGSWETPFPPGQDELVIRRALPDFDFEGTALVHQRDVHGARTTVRFRFVGLSLTGEMELARWLDEHLLYQGVRH
jgi:hypothetical protein